MSIFEEEFRKSREKELVSLVEQARPLEAQIIDELEALCDRHRSEAVRKLKNCLSEVHRYHESAKRYKAGCSAVSTVGNAISIAGLVSSPSTLGTLTVFGSGLSALGSFMSKYYGYKEDVFLKMRQKEMEEIIKVDMEEVKELQKKFTEFCELSVKIRRVIDRYFNSIYVKKDSIWEILDDLAKSVTEDGFLYKLLTKWEDFKSCVGEDKVDFMYNLVTFGRPSNRLVWAGWDTCQVVMYMYESLPRKNGTIAKCAGHFFGSTFASVIDCSMLCFSTIWDVYTFVRTCKSFNSPCELEKRLQKTIETLEWEEKVWREIK